MVANRGRAVVDRMHCAHSSYFELDLYSSVPFTKRGKGKDFLSKGHYGYDAASLYVCAYNNQRNYSMKINDCVVIHDLGV